MCAPSASSPMNSMPWWQGTQTPGCACGCGCECSLRVQDVCTQRLVAHEQHAMVAGDANSRLRVRVRVWCARLVGERLFRSPKMYSPQILPPPQILPLKRESRAQNPAAACCTPPPAARAGAVRAGSRERLVARAPLPMGSHICSMARLHAAPCCPCHMFASSQQHALLWVLACRGAHKAQLGR